MGRRPVWKAARQNRAAAGKTVCKCGGPPKNIILQTRAAWPGKDAWGMQTSAAVLIDKDGTLIDSAPGILATFQKTFEAFGLTVGEQRLRPFLGPPLRSSMAQLLPQAQVEQAVETYRELYQTHGLDGCAPYAGVPQMLQALREAGFVVCVATSKPYPVALRVLRHFGLEQAFDYIGGASMDASLDTKTAVMQLVLGQPQLAGKCPVMVGDRENDMQGARDCGIPAVGALYGYGSQAELAPFSPVFCAQDVPALCAWLLAHRACKEGAKA